MALCGFGVGVCVHLLLSPLNKTVMSEFHDDYPSYELLAHHSEEAGKQKRKKLWMVFWIMLGITLAELYIGMNAEQWGLQAAGKSGLTLKGIFITLTIVKAAYIVLSFMHLGDENRFFRYTVLVPFCVFVLYLVALVDLSEGTYARDGRYEMEHNVTTQDHSTKNHEAGAHAAGAHDAGHHEGGEHHKE